VSTLTRGGEAEELFLFVLDRFGAVHVLQAAFDGPAEAHLLADVARRARERGIDRLIGTYTPGPRNALVADLYGKLGFKPIGDRRWELDLGTETVQSDFIQELQ